MLEHSSGHCCPRGPAATTRGDGNVAMMSDAERRRELRDLFLELLESDIVGYCPIYERIVSAIAEDPDTLDLITEHRMGTSRTPVLFLGATHDLVLRDPSSPLAAIYRGDIDDDPWPLFRQMVHSHRSPITDCMRTRTTQTNEVGRSANLLAVYASISRQLAERGDHRPLAIIEIGPSAGHNRLADRDHVEYRLGDTVAASAGDPTSSVRRRCERRGDTPFPGVTGMREIVLREGLDRAPIDITDPDDAPPSTSPARILRFFDVATPWAIWALCSNSSRQRCSRSSPPPGCSPISPDPTACGCASSSMRSDRPATPRS